MNQVASTGVDKGEFIYSCNCGWIDVHHAIPDTTNSILNLLRVKVNPPSWMNQEQRGIELRIDTPGNLVTFLNLFIVKINPASNNKSLALGILMAHENIREDIQGWPGAKEIGHSHFSDEDLTSDLIGYFLAINDKPGLKDVDGLNGYNFVAPICKMPLDKQKAIEWSQKVFKTYGGSVEEWEKWATPRLECSSAVNKECGDKPRAWPSEFSIDSAAKAGVDWWQYVNWSSFILKQSDENDRIYYMYP